MDADVKRKPEGYQRCRRGQTANIGSLCLAVRWTFGFRGKLYLITTGGRYGVGRETYWVSQGGANNTFLLDAGTFHNVLTQKREDSSMRIGRFVRGCLARKRCKRLTLEKVVEDLVFEIEFDRDFQ